MTDTPTTSTTPAESPEAIIAATSTPPTAQARLDTLAQDKDWGARFLAGDAAAKTEWDRLTRIASGHVPGEVSGEKAQAALDAFMKAKATGQDPARLMREAVGENPPTVDEIVAYSERGQHVQLAKGVIADALSKFELSPGTIDEIMNGCKATPEQCAAAARMQKQKLADPEWGKRLLASDPVAMRENFLMALILSSDQARDAMRDAFAVGKGQSRNLGHEI